MFPSCWQVNPRMAGLDYAGVAFGRVNGVGHQNGISEAVRTPWVLRSLTYARATWLLHHR